MIAVLVGTICAIVCYGRLLLHHVGAGDFAWSLAGARLLLANKNPYDQALLAPHLPYAPDAPLFYPLPALIVALPFAPFPDSIAAALFIGISCAALAWAVTKARYWPLLLFVSPAMYTCLWSAQWTPLLTLALFLPALAPLAIVKPNLGAAILAHRPSWRVSLVCAALLALSVLILPSWPLDWLHNARQAVHVAPVTILPFGPLLLLALFRWRDPRARLLLTLSVLPNRMAFYDQLGLLTIPRSRLPLVGMVVLQWVAFYAMPAPWWDTSARAWIVALCYLPALYVTAHDTRLA
jgi:hypothetical protein